MEAKLEIRETPEGLTLTSTARVPVWQAALASCACFPLLGFVVFDVAGKAVTAAVGVLLAVLQYRQIRRWQVEELQAWNLDFRTGRRHWKYGPPIAVSRAEIVELEFGTGEGCSYRSGLYARLGVGRTAYLLPNLSEQDTRRAIAAIYERFSDMPIAKDNRKLAGHFTTLSLRG